MSSNRRVWFGTAFVEATPDPPPPPPHPSAWRLAPRSLLFVVTTKRVHGLRHGHNLRWRFCLRAVRERASGSRNLVNLCGAVRMRLVQVFWTGKCVVGCSSDANLCVRLFRMLHVFLVNLHRLRRVVGGVAAHWKMAERLGQMNGCASPLLQCRQSCRSRRRGVIVLVGTEADAVALFR